jgi:hypothetical protein
MLKQRILSTLKFFDLQGYPLTLLELHKFLLADIQTIKSRINTDWELINNNDNYNDNNETTIDQVLKCVDIECQNEIEQQKGFYCLRGRAVIINQRLANYIYGIKREQRICSFAKGLRHLPFVRGVALAGSQAQGVQKPDSDIDLLIILEPKFLWLGRTTVTAYFQALGLRRHGKKIADRFCLNHYLAGVKTISEFRNLYTAWEYAKLRPLVYGRAIAEFQQINCPWIRIFFPNFELADLYHPLAPSYSKRGNTDQPPSLQKNLERMLSGKFGRWLEEKLKNWQLPKIRQEEFILVREDELSFHPQSKQRELLAKFFAG